MKFDYKSLEKNYSFGKPNRLFVLVHPGWDYRIGDHLLPLWQRHLNMLSNDDNYALLAVEGYGSDEIDAYKGYGSYWENFAKSQVNYNENIRRWTEQLFHDFKGRFALYKNGFLPDDDECKLWLKGEIGNPPEIVDNRFETHPEVVVSQVPRKTSRVGVYDFFTMEFAGLYDEYCVNSQRIEFPCKSLWRSEIVRFDYPQRISSQEEGDSLLRVCLNR